MTQQEQAEAQDDLRIGLNNTEVSIETNSSLFAFPAMRSGKVLWLQGALLFYFSRI